MVWQKSACFIYGRRVWRDPPAHQTVESAEHAYDRYAQIYDECNSQNNYELWLGQALLPRLEAHGLRMGWALDAGCGTGQAFDPLLIRGWNVVGCDVSSGMLAVAARKFESKVPLLQLDVRSLPSIRSSLGHYPGEAFQLVLLLNDVVNCLTEPGDLERTFSGVARNLARGGLVVFDANALSAYRAGSETELRMAKKGLEWRSLTSTVEPGEIYEEQLSGPEVETHIHRQRHWTDRQIKEALGACGLRSVAVYGQSEENDQILLADSVEESRDYKAIYIASW